MAVRIAYECPDGTKKYGPILSDADSLYAQEWCNFGNRMYPEIRHYIEWVNDERPQGEIVMGEASEAKERKGAVAMRKVKADEKAEEVELTDELMRERTNGGYYSRPVQKGVKNGKLFYRDEGRDEFQRDVMRLVGLDRHPNAGEIFHFAWEIGHSCGYNEVWIYLQDMVPMFEGVKCPHCGKELSK